MKQLPFAFLCIILASYLNVCFAQTPKKLHYQLILRYEDGTPMASQPLNIHLKLSGDSTFTDCWYYETHAVTSNLYGQIDLDIGAGAPIQGSMEAVKWYKGDVYIKYQTELPDGNSLSVAKVAPLGAVPFAMHAKSADDVFLYSEDGTRFDIDVDENGRLMVIANKPPTTGFAPSTRNGDAPLNVSFTDTTTNYPDSWLWYFGDGLSSTEQNPSHKYWVEGWYTVSLSVYNGLTYDTATYENYIHVTGFCPSTVTDIDGNVYNTVLIDDYKCWMKENLKVTHYAHGTPVPFVPETSDWDALSKYDSAYCYYYNNPASEYGALYTWAAATGYQSSNLVPSGILGVCPEGWHLPSYQEFEELSNSLGGRDVAGGKLKEAGFEHWNSPNTGATNESGFTGLPGGYRKEDGGWFYEKDEKGIYWSTYYPYNSYGVRASMLYYDDDYFSTNYTTNPAKGVSVRCMKDY